MSPPLLEWRGVHKAFGAKSVLRGLDLAIAAGEAVALLGGSGVGKSVALRHVIGLVAPDRGRVLVDGADVAGQEEEGLRGIRRRVAMVFQGGALFDSMTVGENVAFGLRERWPPPPAGEVADRVRHVLELVDLPGIEAAMPSDLSGGMRKRVALARSLALEPEAILYDEPTAGLDPITANRVNRLVRELRDRLHVTSVVVTHDVSSALFVADRLVHLQDGRAAFDGSVEDARTRPTPELAAFLEGRDLPERAVR